MQSAELSKQRFFYIDLLESIAIFFVIAYHIGYYDYNFLLGNTEDFICYFRYFCRTILSCCVPLFFLANGYLLLNRDFNLKKHIYKIIRLVVLAVLWGMITLLFLMLIRKQFLFAKEFFSFLWNWSYGWLHHFWFIQTLVIIYLFFPLIKLAYDKRRDIFYFFVIMTAILTFGNTALNITASIASHYIRATNEVYAINFFNKFNPYYDFYAYSLVYFCVGGLMYEFKNKMTFLNNIWLNLTIILLSMSALFAIGVIMSTIQNELWDVVWKGFDTIFTFVNVICIFFLCIKYKGKNNLLRKIFYIISVNTLGIYFIHVLLIHFSETYVHKVITDYTIFSDLILSLVILFGSLVIALILKKIPLLKKLLV